MDTRELVLKISGALINEKSAKEFFEVFEKEFQDDIDRFTKIEKIMTDSGLAKKFPETKGLIRSTRESREWTLVVTCIIEAFLLNQLRWNHLISMDSDLQKMLVDKKIKKIMDKKIKISKNQGMTKKDKEVLKWIRDYMKRARGNPDL